MNFYKKYFDTAVALIKEYKGNMPLSVYLKQYFAQHKKHGAKDRRHISHLCYCYYRPGQALKDLTVEERLLSALFLCTYEKGDWLALYEACWQDNYKQDIDNRIAFIQSLHPFNIEDIFYNLGSTNNDIDKQAFAKAHLIQPHLFVRIRPGNYETVIHKLQAADISYKLAGDNCIALDNTTKMDTLLEINKEVVIQDYSSQKIAAFITMASENAEVVTVWDCCAASGGKSILAIDTLSPIKLTASDIRPSIIHNLKQRFKVAGIANYQSFVADLTNQYQAPMKYDLVICDAPCSGSGTWARTPEQLCFITEEKIKHYTALQKKIVTTALKAVKKGGCFLYITCSVYKAENEEIVKFILQKTPLQLIKKEVLKGYEVKADTMFAALFTNA